MAAIEAVPDALVDEVSLCGPRRKIAERLMAWRSSGIATLLCSTTRIETVRMMAELVLQARSDPNALRRNPGNGYLPGRSCRNYSVVPPGLVFLVPSDPGTGVPGYLRCVPTGHKRKSSVPVFMWFVVPEWARFAEARNRRAGGAAPPRIARSSGCYCLR
jgi:hypothetical protein